MVVVVVVVAGWKSFSCIAFCYEAPFLILLPLFFLCSVLFRPVILSDPFFLFCPVLYVALFPSSVLVLLLYPVPFCRVLFLPTLFVLPCLVLFCSDLTVLV